MDWLRYLEAIFVSSAIFKTNQKSDPSMKGSDVMKYASSLREKHHTLSSHKHTLCRLFQSSRKSHFNRLTQHGDVSMVSLYCP